MKRELNISITPRRLFVGMLLAAAVAWAAPFWGPIAIPALFKSSVQVQGGLYADVLDAGTVNVATLNVTGVPTLTGTIPTVKANIIDAGVLFLQGTGPVYRVIPFTTAAIDFASTTTTCTDSGAQTATGARTTDTCTVGMPSTLTAGGTGLNSTFSCYVSAADAVKVRHCAAGTADDPGSVTFTGYVISAQQ